MDSFKLVSPYQPTGDQPGAIEELVAGVLNGLDEQVLLGVTGSGKGIFSLFLAAIVIVSFFDEGGFFHVVTLAVKGLLGKWGYFVAPVCLVLAGFILLLHRGRPVKFRVFSALILPVLLSNMINLWQYHPAKGLGFRQRRRSKNG